MDKDGQKLLAIFPAKFQKSMWIKTGTTLIVFQSLCYSLMSLMSTQPNEKILMIVLFRIWIGSFIVVDESGREEAAESGRKVGGMVTQVLYHEQVRQLQKSPDWCVCVLNCSFLIYVNLPVFV